MSDELLHRQPIPAPLRGIIEGIEPASADFPADASPDLENIRLTRSAVDTRLGFASWKASGGAGVVHYLARVYRKDGTNYTLAAQGGVLYQQTGSGSFAGATGGTGLGTAPKNGRYCGVTLKDEHYFLDRLGALRKWNPTDGVRTVTQGTAPSVAPTTKRRTFAYIVPAAITTVKNETWQGSAGAEPTGWDDTAQFVATVADTTNDAVPDFPGLGACLKIAIASSGSKNDEILLDAATELFLASSDIAWFFQQSNKRFIVAFEIGQNKAGEFSIGIDPPEADQVYMMHYPVGALPGIKYARFKCKRVPSAARTLYVSRLYLPGRKFGKYQYRFSFCNTTTGIETELSPASEFVDCSVPITDYQTTDTAALEKSVELTTSTQTLPSVTTHPQVAWYVRGGLPELTKDGSGGDKWLRLARTGNINSSVGAIAAAGDLVLDVPKNEGAENLVAGDWVVIERGVAGKEELVKVASVTQDFSGTLDRITLDASTPIAAVGGHSVSTSNKVTPAYVDNTSNASIDTTTNTLPERDDAPSGCHWIAKAADGRLWLFRTDEKLEVAVSNLPTVDHPLDCEVFPDGVSPTRGSLLQGFRFYLDGEAHGDEIIWGGMFRGTPTILTTRACYQCYFSGQADYRPAVKVWDNLGCIAGETVCEVNGALYWVADGPRVMRWDGQGAPEDVSYQKVNVTLAAAPADYITHWFAQGRADKEGARYDLFMDPTLTQAYTDLVIDGSLNTKVTSVARPFVAADVGRVLTILSGTGFTVGAYSVVSVAAGAATLDRAVGTTSSTGGVGDLHSGNAKVLSHNAVTGAWETHVYYASSLPLAWTTAMVQGGPGDDREYYAAHPTSGNVRQLESGSTDNSAAIPIRAKSKKFSFDGYVVRGQHWYGWYVATGSDTLTVQVRMSDSEYRNATDFSGTDGDPAQSWNETLADSDTSELEAYQRLNFHRLLGRTLQVIITGSVSNRPSLSRQEVCFSLVRKGRVTG